MDLRKDWKGILSGLSAVITTFWAIQEIAKNYGVSLTVPTSLSAYWLVLAFVGLTTFPFWAGYQLHSWLAKRRHLIRRPTTQETGVPRLLELVKDGGEIKAIGTEFSRWAEQSADIRNLIIQKNVKFTFLAPDPASIPVKDCASNLERTISAELVQEGEIKRLEGSLATFRKMRDSLGEDDFEKIQIGLFDLPLTHSMAIAIPTARENAEAHVWPYLHKIHGDQRPYVIYESRNTEHRVMFGKCLESFEYVFSKSQPSESVQVRVTSRVSEQEPTPQVMKTFDRGYDPDRAARLDPKNLLAFMPFSFGQRNILGKRESATPTSTCHTRRWSSRTRTCFGGGHTSRIFFERERLNTTTHRAILRLRTRC
jgi:hypothetical protein